MRNRGKRWAWLIIGLLLLSACQDDNRQSAGNAAPPAVQTPPRMSYAEAQAQLARLVEKVPWAERLVTRKAQVSLDKAADLKDTLPDIAKFPLVVDPPASPDKAIVEIFASTEKSGSGTDGWIVEVANDFNAQNIRLQGGKLAQVRIRKIASGTGYEYIASQRYLPQGFTPSNHLWIKMVQAHGVATQAISERLVHNTAGIVMKEAQHKQLQAQYGKVSIRQVIDAVAQGNIAMGYTDPFASSTGLNFLATILATFAEGDASAMLSPGVVSAFEAFQRGVPFVSLTTIQMRQSVEQDGSLDAFIMEHQTFVNTPVLQSGYTFLPFGPPHDNPLYGIGKLSAEGREVLQRFAQFAAAPAAQKLATQYGFNALEAYQAPFPTPGGDFLIQAQKLWKQKKDAGKPLLGVFVSDVSGSMNGAPLHNLQRALIAGGRFIDPNNAIGLVVFHHEVKVLVPIRPFNLLQRASFTAAVEDMQAGGNTAMYDGILIGLKMLVEAQGRFPDSKPILFVLTDGESNRGHQLQDIEAVVAGLKIPIYTIGYNARLDVLARVSAINEAASMNADEVDIAYRIGALLNAEM